MLKKISLVLYEIYKINQPNSISNNLYLNWLTVVALALEQLVLNEL